MEKSDELEYENGCLRKAAMGEPIFVLRGQDLLAPSTIRQWVDTARRLGTPPEKLSEALRCARAMEAWQKHTVKIPD